MDHRDALLTWLQSHKYRSRDDSKIRQLLAVQTPETTADLVRTALWSAAGSNSPLLETVPSPYEEILKRDLFLTVHYLSDCKDIEPRLAAELAEALAAVFLDGVDWNAPSPLRQKAWEVLPKVRTNMIGTLLFVRLQRALGDVEWSVRLNAATALGQAGQALAPCLKVVHTLLEDLSPNIRWCAAHALEVIGQASDEIVTLLIAAVKKRGVSPPVRVPRESALVEQIREENERGWRWTAAEALGLLRAEGVLPVLLEALQDDDCMMRFYAARALGKFDHPSEDVLQALVTALPDPVLNSSMLGLGNYEAAKAMGELTASFPPLEVKMLALLQHGNEYVRGGATTALGYVSTPSEEILNGLTSATEDKHLPVRYQAFQALAKIGQSNARIIEICLSAANDPRRMDRSAALKALGRLKPASEKNRQALLAAARSPHGQIRLIVAEALGHLGDTSEEVMILLSGLLEQEETAITAASALVQLGRETAEERNALLKGLQHEYEGERLQAAEAMSSLNTSSLEIEKGLIDALQDPDEDDLVRFAAWRSLWALLQKKRDDS